MGDGTPLPPREDTTKYGNGDRLATMCQATITERLPVLDAASAEA